MVTLNDVKSYMEGVGTTEPSHLKWNVKYFSSGKFPCLDFSFSVFDIE